MSNKCIAMFSIDKVCVGVLGSGILGLVIGRWFI